MDRVLLENYLREEQEDEIKYKILSNELKNEYPKFAGIFKDIANEEHSHSELIKHILEKLDNN